MFQVLATGPGTNTIVSTTRGQGLVVLSYLLRIVFGSLIVSTITLDVLREAPLSDALPRSLNDLEGRRVAARPGSVSEKLLRTPPLLGRVTVVPLPRLSDAPALLLERRVDAVLADEQQLRYVREQVPPRQRGRLQLVLDGQRPESQAYAYSPSCQQASARGSTGRSARPNAMESCLESPHRPPARCAAATRSRAGVAQRDAGLTRPGWRLRAAWNRPAGSARPPSTKPLQKFIE